MCPPNPGADPLGSGSGGWGWQDGKGMGAGPMGMGMEGGPMGRRGRDLLALLQAQDFDRTFIEQMIPHHPMGVMMASVAQLNAQQLPLRQFQQER